MEAPCSGSTNGSVHGTTSNGVNVVGQLNLLGAAGMLAASNQGLQGNKRLLCSVDLRHCILTCPGVRQLSL